MLFVIQQLPALLSAIFSFQIKIVLVCSAFSVPVHRTTYFTIIACKCLFQNIVKFHCSFLFLRMSSFSFVCGAMENRYITNRLYRVNTFISICCFNLLLEAICKYEEVQIRSRFTTVTFRLIYYIVLISYSLNPCFEIL